MIDKSYCYTKCYFPTMRTQACFPSMKPFGMALGVRISYLRQKNVSLFKWSTLNKDAQLRPLSKQLVHVECYLCLNSWKTMRLGKPCLQIRIPSRTPLHLSWSRTRWGSSLPAYREKQAFNVMVTGMQPVYRPTQVLCDLLGTQIWMFGEKKSSA